MTNEQLRQMLAQLLSVSHDLFNARLHGEVMTVSDVAKQARDYAAHWGPLSAAGLRSFADHLEGKPSTIDPCLDPSRQT